VAIRLTVLPRRQQRQRALTIGRGDPDRRQRAPTEGIVQLEPRAGDQLRHGIAVQPHDLPDLLVRERLELTQSQNLALARRQRRVGGLQELARGRQEHGALRILLEVARFGPPRLGVLRDRFDPSSPLDHVVARVAGDGQDVGGQVEIAPLERRQPLEQSHERLLGGVGRVVRGAEQSHAEAVHAPLMAVVELGERISVPGDRELREFLRITGDPCVSGDSDWSGRRISLAFCRVSLVFWPVVQTPRPGPRVHELEDAPPLPRCL
jgi:hypothetical protein